MNLADILCLGVALWALSSLGLFAVLVMRALLPQSQAMLALSKLKDLEDEKIKKILDRFGAPAASPSVKSQIDEITRKAQAAGFQIDKPARQNVPSTPEPPMMPMPEPTLDWPIVE